MQEVFSAWVLRVELLALWCSPGLGHALPKLLSGVVMLLLGAVLLLRPQWLQ